MRGVIRMKDGGRWSTVRNGFLLAFLAALGCVAAVSTTSAGALPARVVKDPRHPVKVPRHPHRQALSGSVKSAHVRVVAVPVGGRGGGGTTDPADDYPLALKNRPMDSVLDQWREYNRECTSFVAWALASRNGFNMPFWANAVDWGARARAKGYRVDSSPAPGSVAWSNVGRWGHVAYVQRVSGGSVFVEEYNRLYTGTYSSRTVPAATFTGYIHFADRQSIAPDPPVPPPVTTTVAQPPTTTTVVVTSPGSTTTATAPTTTAPTTTTTAPTTTTPSSSGTDTTPPSAPGSLATSGATQSSITLSWAASTDNKGVAGYKLFLNGGQVGSTGSTSFGFGGLLCGTGYVLAVAAYDAAGNTSSASAISAGTSDCPPPVWNETTGGTANTWTNYTNAGGNQGPTIPAYETVAISCKVPGFRVADGNTWWYRIASSPWSDQYFVSADAFYNNGATSGSLHGTPFVDPAVRDC